MSSIDLRYEYESWVQNNIVQLFSNRGIKITTNAQQLLVFAIQSQVEDHLLSEEKLFEQVNKVSGEILLDSYRKRNGEKTMDFNRAFHLLDEWGFVVKFPFKPTSPRGFRP